MKELIAEYSRWKVDIKFHIVKPLISNRKRKIILFFGGLLFFAFAFIIFPKVLLSMHLFSFVTFIILFLVFYFLYDFLTRLFLLRITHIGEIKFLADKMEILNYNNAVVVSYSEIIKIRYQRNVPKTVLTKSPDTKTFIVEFILIEKPSVFVEIEDKLFLLEEDFNQFRTNEPNLETVLNYVKPKHGLENVKKIKLPIDFYQI